MHDGVKGTGDANPLHEAKRCGVPSLAPYRFTCPLHTALLIFDVTDIEKMKRYGLHNVALIYGKRSDWGVKVHNGRWGVVYGARTCQAD